MLGWAPAERFLGTPPPQAARELARRNRLIDLELLQIAQVDLWRREGVLPDGVLAVSMGEAVAPYAAGCFSRSDSARVIAAVAHASTRSPSPSRIFVLAVDASGAERLCRTAPAPLHYLGSMDPASSSVFAREADAEVLRDFLGESIHREAATEWSQHTPLLDLDADWMRDQLRHVRALPARCPIYSATTGGQLPGDARFGFDFFMWMATRPYHFSAAASTALDHGFDVVISFGAHSDTRDSVAICAQARGKTVRLVDSMRAEDESSGWKQALADTSGIRGGRRGSPARLTASTVNFSSAAVQARLLEAYEELRVSGGVHFIERHGYWLLLNHADVLNVLAQPDRFSSKVPTVGELDAVLLGSDPPAHTAIRRTLLRHFAPPKLAHRANLCRLIADELLQTLREGREVEVVTGFARPLVERLGADVLGVDTDAAAALGESMEARGGDVLPDYAHLDRALDAVLHGSTTYAWLRSADGGSMDHTGARSLIRLLWVAGTDTLKRTLPAAVLLLLKHDQLREPVAADPALLARFVDEVLRLGPAEQQIVRVAVDDVEVGGVPIPAGAVVRLSLAAANRDPACFTDPYAVRLDRAPGAHLAFGGGVHRCLGAMQARSQLSIALQVLLHVAPGFRCVQPLELIRTAPGAPLAGIEQLLIHA